MADGIDVEQTKGGTLDTDLLFADEAQGKGILDILQRFGDSLQTDLVKSLASKGKNSQGSLSQSIKFNVSVFGSTYVFALSWADYGAYVDEGVNGINSAYNTRFSFKSLNPSKDEVNSLTDWVRQKGFGAFGISDPKKAQGIAFGIAKNNRRFGIKPSNFFKDVINDGRVGELEDELNNVFGSII